MPADPTGVALTHQVLAQLGVSLADLQGAALDGDGGRAGVVVPTVAQYLPRVIAAGPGAARTYGSYWTRMAVTWGDRRVDSITASDIEALQRQVIAVARKRRTSCDGRHAGEHLIAAARALFNRVVADGLTDPAANPALRVPKPRRLPSPRRALTPDELDAINVAARSSGNDVVLDALHRLHTETACRRGGALALRLMDLDVDRGIIRLREKGGTLRWQPVTLHLAARLAEHAEVRGAVLPADALLRYRDGRALTRRRYDHLWQRLGRQLPWVTAQGISTHWLRHTALTWVERHFGYSIARAYASHTDSSGAATTTYIKAGLQAVATALAAMTGQPHSRTWAGHRPPVAGATSVTDPLRAKYFRTPPHPYAAGVRRLLRLCSGVCAWEPGGVGVMAGNPVKPLPWMSAAPAGSWPCLRVPRSRRGADRGCGRRAV